MTRPVALLVERLGETDAARVSERFGGTRLAVPLHPRYVARLVEELGDRLAGLLVFHFGGSRVYVPTAQPAHRGTVSARRVKRLTDRGWSSARIALKLGCSERQVHAKRAQLRQRARSNVHSGGGNLGLENEE